MPGKIVTREEWLESRLSLLAREKAHIAESDALAKLRAEMPMVKISKPYTFAGPNNASVSLLDMFQGKKQLILQHVMFDPSWEGACRGCSATLDDMPLHLEHLNNLETMYVAVARAPYEKIERFCKDRMGWPIPFYSSLGSDFNYDFDVTLDEAVKPSQYNYTPKAELIAKGLTYYVEGEQPGLSVFYRDGDDVYHTYSAFARGTDNLGMTFPLLDLTPLGRQVEDPALPYWDTYGKDEKAEKKSCH